MKVSLKWLRDYVDIVLSPEKLAEKLTLSGTKVEGIARIGGGWDDILTAEIVALAPHPNADRLQLCTVNLGDREQTVATGAFNIAVGDRVPFIGLGGKLPNGLVLEARKMRGFVSAGMVLAEDELGIGEDHAGIYILDAGTPPGLPLFEVLGDVVLDLEITPNRPDCLCMVGVAREVAAITGQELRLPALHLDEQDPPAHDLAAVRVEDADLCPRYTARVVTGITVGPSPSWLAARVRAAGVRSINNIVDISNYIMMEWGQPLHTFDLQTVAGGQIVVRRAHPGETLETLDGQRRELTPETLLIADAERAVGIAGVMGAANSEITPGTTAVLIESANFAPTSIRRTSLQLGLRSEASHRFEKGLPWTLPPVALDHAAALIASVCGGIVHRGIIDVAVPAPAPVTIDLPKGEVSRLLGVSFSRDRIVSSLQPLGFEVSLPRDAQAPAAGPITATVPSWRADVKEAADLVEEVARMLGFDNIPVTMLRGVVAAPHETPIQIWSERIRRFLLGCGLTDLATYSLISAPSLAALFAMQGPVDDVSPEQIASLAPNAAGVRERGAGFTLLRLTNPLTPEQEILRPSLLPGLTGALRSNLRHTTEGLAFFELARCFFPRPGELPYERMTLGIALAGQREPRSWQTPPAEVDFYDLKGIVEELFAHCGVSGYRLERGAHPVLHPGRCARLIAADGREIGYLGEIHPALAPTLDLANPRAYVLEFDADVLISLCTADRQAQPISRFPVVKRDIAVIVPDRVETGEIVATINGAGGDLLEDVRVFDVYRGDPVPAGHKSVACALTLQADDRTLSDVEAAAVFAHISNRLTKAVGGQVRES